MAWRREGLRRAVATTALCAAGVGWRAGPARRALRLRPRRRAAGHDLAYRRSLARLRPYWFWVAGSPTAWALAVGPPIVLAAVAAARRAAPAALGLVVVVAVAAVGGYTKAETERIWLPFVPLACVAAAEAGLGSRRLRTVLALLLAQAIAAQALFYTVW